jgi:hypothetical protein
MNKPRLEKLAQVLETWIKTDECNFEICHKQTECGTVGCALDHRPYIWPRKWKISDPDYPPYECEPILRSIASLRPLESAMEWFDLNYNEATHLFTPCDQECEIYGGTYLWDYSTPAEVAHNIREFIRKMEEKP